MGTLVSQNPKVIDKLIPALAGCKKHRFIVSKGKNGDDWELPANCVGANNLNQLELLKSGCLDAFITHTGNNSFTETCYFGIPMNVTSDELSKAIDYVTGSEEIQSNIKKISEAVRKDDAMDRLFGKQLAALKAFQRPPLTTSLI
ncbi:hypothetical protein L1887_57616 [Cichorium endivia]|nr:hypothetical protein L1887_57616 [Cichorium endivia]